MWLAASLDHYLQGQCQSRHNMRCRYSGPLSQMQLKCSPHLFRINFLCLSYIQIEPSLDYWPLLGIQRALENFPGYLIQPHQKNHEPSINKGK